MDRTPVGDTRSPFPRLFANELSGSIASISINICFHRSRVCRPVPKLSTRWFEVFGRVLPIRTHFVDEICHTIPVGSGFQNVEQLGMRGKLPGKYVIDVFVDVGELGQESCFAVTATRMDAAVRIHQA